MYSKTLLTLGVVGWLPVLRFYRGHDVRSRDEHCAKTTRVSLQACHGSKIQGLRFGKVGGVLMKCEGFKLTDFGKIFTSQKSDFGRKRCR